MTPAEARTRLKELYAELEQGYAEYSHQLNAAGQGDEPPFSSDKFYETHRMPSEILREAFALAQIVDGREVPS